MLFSAGPLAPSALFCGNRSVEFRTLMAGGVAGAVGVEKGVVALFLGVVTEVEWAAGLERGAVMVFELVAGLELDFTGDGPVNDFVSLIQPSPFK